MNDEVGRQLQALHERAPEGRPDVARVLRGGRKRKLRRRTAAAGLVLAVAIAGVAGVPALFDNPRVAAPDDKSDVAHHEDGAFVPADDGDATYELFAFDILYPWAPVDSRPISRRERERYCQTRDEWECGHRREQAGFSYEWRWATSRHPGSVRCRVILTSAEGSVVGSTTWGLSGLEPTSRHPHVVGVRVSDRPAEARAECEAGAYAPGRGVDVEFVRAEAYTPTHVGGESPPAERIRLVFEATALAPSHVDSRACTMKVQFASGRRETTEFTTNRGEGTWKYETGYPASDPVVDAGIKCRAIRARGG